MKIQDLLEHHHISRNPFAEEDAQTDPVFKELCIDGAYHPTWDKVYGDPSEPATSIVFGEKGSGKTAIRLQISRHIKKYNDANPDNRLLVIHYEDFNPYLDRFHARIGIRRRADKVLSRWRLWDHMDAILTIGVTGLIDTMLEARKQQRNVDVSIDVDPSEVLDRHQKRDLLLLAACYDESTSETRKGRWGRLRSYLKFNTLKAALPMAIAYGWTVLSIICIIVVISMMISSGADAPAAAPAESTGIGWLHALWLCPLIVGLGWLPWLWRLFKSFALARGIVKNVRTGNNETTQLCGVLMNFTASELASQPLPNQDRTDDRYELFSKFQSVLDSLGYKGVIVLVDRLDEPHLINGSAELMKALLWPMLDNKFLKHPGLGLKMLLPIELTRFIDREERDFYQRARLDKQNMIRSFEWTGEALFDVANSRLQACAVEGHDISLNDIFHEDLTHTRLINALRSLRVPRHMFKFMYRLLVDHCHAHTIGEPAWEISAETFEKALALYLREQDSFDRGMGAG